MSSSSSPSSPTNSIDKLPKHIHHHFLSLKKWKLSFSFFFDFNDINRISSPAYWKTIAASTSSSNRLSQFIHRMSHDVFFVLFGNSYLTNLVSNILIVLLNSISLTFVLSVKSPSSSSAALTTSKTPSTSEENSENQKNIDASTRGARVVQKTKKKRKSSKRGNDDGDDDSLYTEDIVITFGLSGADGRDRLSELVPGL